MRRRTALRTALAAAALAAAAACESDLQFRPPERPVRVSVAGAPLGLTVRFAAAEDATGYALYVASAGSTAISRLECAAPPCAIGGLTAATEYLVRVATLDRTGESDPSAPVSARTLSGDEIIVVRAWRYDTGGYTVLAGPGDLDGDGDGELFVASPEGDGRVELFLGGAAGPADQPSATLEGPAGARFGWAMAGAGDVNEDGFADIAIGSPGSDDGDAGRVQLFRGGINGFTGAPAWNGSTFEAGSASGSSIATGDVDRDGLTDIVSGAPAFTGATSEEAAAGPAVGRVDLYLGPGPSSGALFLSVDSVLGLGTDGAFGFAVALADLDGDGHDDLAVSEPSWDAGTGFFDQDRGRIHVFRWDPVAEELAEPPLTVVGIGDRALFGLSLAAAGDTDGDGRQELLVGAPGAGFTAGAAVLYEGDPSFVLTEVWRADGEVNEDALGTAVAGGFDLNRDGYSDVAVGRPGAEGGEVRVLYGSPLGLSRELVFPAFGDAELFGSVIAPAGDVNGDGFDDLAASGMTGRVEVITGGRPSASPVVDAGYPLQGAPGEAVQTAAASFVDAVPDVSWTCVWEWGDGETDTLAECAPDGAVASHVYDAPGEYDVRLRVLSTDSRMGEAITGASIE